MTEARSIATLVNAKSRFFTPMIIIYMVGYIGLTALAGFAKGFMALKVIGVLNIGFFLIANDRLIGVIAASLPDQLTVTNGVCAGAVS